MPFIDPDAPVHLYVNAHLGCGVGVSYTRTGADKRFTDDPKKASCYRCARHAPGIDDECRQTIWDNANERLDRYTKSPWEKAKEQTGKREAQVSGS